MYVFKYHKKNQIQATIRGIFKKIFYNKVNT